MTFAIGDRVIYGWNQPSLDYGRLNADPRRYPLTGRIVGYQVGGLETIYLVHGDSFYPGTPAYERLERELEPEAAS